MVPVRRLGTREVSAVGLGGARWALAAEPDPELAACTLRAAVESGVTLVDTAPAYTPATRSGFGEELLGRTLRTELRRGVVAVSTKGGHWRDGESFPVDGSPEVLHRQCRESLTRLGIEAIDLYLLHWPDPKVPIEDSVGALAELRAAGLARRVGVCNVDTDQLSRARSVTRIDAVQNRFSPLDLAHRPVLDACSRSGIAFLAYSPLGGTAGVASLSDRLPRFAEQAARHGVSTQELCIAWLLAQAAELIPIVGASRPETIRSAVRAADLTLAPEVLEVLTEDCASTRGASPHRHRRLPGRRDG